MPLASDASGNGTQDYRQVAGRATAIAIDPADPSGNTVYIGGAQGGIWTSTNAANPVPNAVVWNAIADNQATLSIGSIAIQPGNSDPAKSVILAATGESNDAADSYFGLGILRSTDAGTTWSLIGSANGGNLSFRGLGGTRMAFSTAPNQRNTVVSAMATSSEGLVDGAITAGTTRGLYTSQDAGQSWTYAVPRDSGNSIDSTSATSVVYNTSASKFFAAIRFHGFYSSPDGVNWTRLINQPGAALSTSACPAQSTSNNHGCPIYRGEISVVDGRLEMYAWYIYLDANGNARDGGIWQSVDGGANWNAISDTGITNCGDIFGCGVEQGDYNLELQAVPYGTTATDLYAGAVNLYKCTISSLNPGCTSFPFMNLTHVYGCAPISAPAHVHPAQHALAYALPAGGNELLYFANDGGIYRALDGITGLNSGSCSGSNAFDDLNQNLGSMTQFVSLSLHPNDPNTLLGGTQGNGSPTTNKATTNSSWWNVLGGDGGYNAIDALAASNFYASNPDVPPGGLGIQLCSNGVNCHSGDFDFVVTSSTLAGDDGAFYVPFILDPGASTAMLVGTCRIWRGPRSGGSYTAVSPNFDTLGSGSCLGDEVNQVRAIAAAGMPDSYGSSIIYATTSGLGPINGPLGNPAGGRVWVTTNAMGGSAYFTDVTNNGPQGNINPNQFPASGVATDSSDVSGKTAYVTIMGFTGGAGHVWETTDAGASWIDVSANLPDSPVNAVVVYSGQVFVATDVGVFASPTKTSPNWTELGPTPSSGQSGYLPNVAVTALSIFSYGGQQLLRASTYGRGIWEFNLVVTPDFKIAVSNSPLTIFAEQTGTFNGTATAVNGYSSAVTLSCTSGTNSPPGTCTPSPGSLIPGNKSPFTIKVGGTPGDYNFNVKGAGSDTNHIVHTIPVSLHIIDYGMSNPSPASVTVPRGTTSPAVGFKITAAGAFNQSVDVSCTSDIANAICTLNPGNTVYPTSAHAVNMTATIDVPLATTPGSYTVNLQASTAGAPSTLITSLAVEVVSNADFSLKGPDAFPNVKVGSSGTTGTISITSQDGFAGTVTLNCPVTYGNGSCSISPTSISSFPASATLTINGTSLTAGSYSISITGTSGSIVHTLPIAFDVGDYSISGTETLSTAPGGQSQGTFKLTSNYSYAGNISAACDVSAVAGALCSLSAPSAIALASGATQSFTANISVPNSTSPGTFKVKINTKDTDGSPSHSLTVLLSVSQDFVITSSTPSQTVVAGQSSGPYALSVQPVGSSFSAAVTLACTAGLPAGAQCAFSPSTPVTPGTSAVDVVMSITTTKASRSASQFNSRSRILMYATLLLPGLVFGGAVSQKRNAKRRLLQTLFAFSLFVFLPSCGGVSSGGGGGGGGGSGNPITYQVTVTGTSPGTPSDSGHTTVVTLVVD